MQEKLKKWIREEKILVQNDHLIVAVSGGVDSLCLLLLLEEWQEEFSLHLDVVYVHHGLRVEADEERCYVEKLCKEKSIPFKACFVDVITYQKKNKQSQEEAARYLRYEALEKVRKEKGADKIAVGHHQADQAETILFHLFRGSGVKGLQGMKAHHAHIIRPLLSCTKQEIEEYVKEKGYSFCIDSSNFSDAYTRNRIRHSILSYAVQHINAKTVSHLAEFGQFMGEVDQYLEDKMKKTVKTIGKIKGNLLYFSEKDLYGLRVFEQYYFWRLAFCEIGLPGEFLEQKHILSIQNFLQQNKNGQIHLPQNMLFQKSCSIVSIGKQKEEKRIGDLKESFVFALFPYEKTLKIPINIYTKWLNYDKIQSIPDMRFRKTGDYLTLSGGRKKTIKKEMIDEKIPEWERDSIPLLAVGQHVLWMVGGKISEYYKIIEKTRMVLQVTYLPKEKSSV
ncbi:tRNA(Ile)-lysidine synthase [Clostridia bacterium]|nr:tRNA(Ile)-lysidine synthase [Clostridia bacterium]